jgi:hypothetical protein
MPVIGYPTQTQIGEQIRNGLRIRPEDVVDWPLVLHQVIAIESQRQYHDSLRRAVEYIPLIGAALRQVKAKLKHGEWGNWLQTDFYASERTAQLYMQVEENWPMVQAAGVDQQPGASLGSIRKFIIQALKLAKRAAEYDDSENERNGPNPGDNPPLLDVKPDDRLPMDFSFKEDSHKAIIERIAKARQRFNVDNDSDAVDRALEEWEDFISRNGSE